MSGRRLIFISNPGRTDGVLDLDDGDTGGENWSDSGYILKLEPIGFLCGLYVKCERKDM